ncbi:MAG: N-acetylmuramoyl-L-alanine amidase, partial [Terriglobales bacterium]
MSAPPNRVDRQTSAGLRPPLEQGGRVLSSIGNKEGLRALREFSDLHEVLRRTTFSAGPASEWRQTERFILHEVLQLICMRAQKLTHSETVLIALLEGNELVCRAAAGSHSVPKGTHLESESRFLQESLESGTSLRCDDVETDAGFQHDFARQSGARSSVVVPLCGRRERMGVLQAFSAAPRAFTDWDVRCLELFGELVLGALKPADQDRRLRWLSETKTETTKDGIAKSLSAELASAKTGLAMPASSAAQQPAASPPLSELTAAIATERAASLYSKSAEVQASSRRVQGTARVSNAKRRPGAPQEHGPKPGLLHDVFWPLTSRPGLSVVAAMIAVAGLFSAGVWWGMQADTRSRGNSPIKGAAPSHLAASQAPSGVSPHAADGTATAAAASISTDSALAPVPENKLADLPKITGVRHWSSPVGSTVVIDMDDQVNYEVHRLMSPDRIYFDLLDTALPPDLEGKTMDVGDASLASVRVAQPVAGVTRIVLDTKDGSNFSVSMETNPYRLVIELHKGVEALAAGRAVVAQAPLTAKVSPPQQALPARTGKFRIVLDAGHGGWDLGTVGRQGLLEKDLVLDVAQRLGKLLQSRIGAEVMFTRTADDYVALDQRADFANQAQADLFVSVHANYSNAATARGVETYYTNLFSSPGLKEIEKQTNAITSAPAALSVPGLREKTEESRRLAASVQRSLYATLAANNPNIRDRGIKDASFVVLTGTTMPSILTEISFVSSPADEQNLQSAAYRQQIAEALYKG